MPFAPFDAGFSGSGHFLKLVGKGMETPSEVSSLVSCGLSRSMAWTGVEMR